MKSGLMGWIGMLCCVACSVLDPDIPEYSSGQALLPEMKIASVDQILLRQVNLKIHFEIQKGHKPLKLFLCYSRDHDLPDIADEVIDLLPHYQNGTVNLTVQNLLPSTQYYSRLYVETSKEYKYSDCFKFKTAIPDPDQAWKKVCDFPIENDWYDHSVVIDEDAYIRGTKLEDDYDTGDATIWKYTPSSNLWEKIVDCPGKKRCEPVMFSINSRLYFGLGYTINDNNTINERLFDFWEYDPLTDGWARKSDYPKLDAVVMASFESKGKGYLVASAALWSALPMTVLEYDPTKDRWTKKADFPGKKVARCFVATVTDRPFVISGAHSPEIEYYSKAVWEYVSESDSWFRRTDFSGTGRWSMRGFVIGDRLFAGYGEQLGSSNMMELVDDLWEYQLQEDRWLPRASFSGWIPYFLSLSFGVGDAGYIGAAKTGLWKYTPELDR